MSNTTANGTAALSVLSQACTTNAMCNAPGQCCASSTIAGLTMSLGCQVSSTISTLSVGGATTSCKLGSALENSITSLVVLAVSLLAFA